jgi:hypothetical protein
MDITMTRISLYALIIITSLLSFSCEDYDELRPLLRRHASELEKTAVSIRKSENSVQISTSLRAFNGSMNGILAEYRDAGKKHPGLKNIFVDPPSSIRNEVSRVLELNTALRHSLLLTVDHSADSSLRLHLAETISLLDALNRE